MLDECEVALIQGVFLRFMSGIQRHLFTPINQPTVLESEFAL